MCRNAGLLRPSTYDHVLRPEQRAKPMIHRIRIENFKCIADVTVELSPVTVLVGQSGTGKSNFLHAIRFLRDALRNGSYADFCRERKPAPAANPTALPKFEVEFSVDEYPERFIYHLNTFCSANDPDWPKQEESLALGDRVLFHRKVDKWVTEPDQTVVPIPRSFPSEEFVCRK